MALPPISKQALVQVLSSAGPVRAIKVTLQADGAVRADEPQLHRMLMTMQETGFTAPFDWQTEFNGREDDLKNITLVHSADLETLRKIMTAHLRIDRISGGYHLPLLIQSGYWAACIARIDDLSQSM